MTLMFDGMAEIDSLVLLRYIRGDRSADVMDAISVRMAANPGARVMLSRIERIQDSLGADVVLTDAMREGQWSALASLLEEPVPAKNDNVRLQRELREGFLKMRGGPSLGKQIVRGKPFSNWTLSLRSFVAAALLCVIAIAAASEWRSRSIATPVLHTYTASAGQRIILRLSDGSRIVLGPATTLTVLTPASAVSTDIHVAGQALFSVAHDPDRQFRVRVGNSVAQVLGTTFLVRRYRLEPVARVVVVDGRVGVHSAFGAHTTDRVATSRDVATIDDSGHVQVAPNAVVEEYTGWTGGQLIFNKTPVRDIAIELGRAYNVEIHLGDSILTTQTLTWTVPVNQLSLADVTEALALAIDAHVVRSGNVITIVRGQTISRRPIRFKYPSSVEQTYGR